jgi:hypothetical protein
MPFYRVLLPFRTVFLKFQCDIRRNSPMSTKNILEARGLPPLSVLETPKYRGKLIDGAYAHLYKLLAGKIQRGDGSAPGVTPVTPPEPSPRSCDSSELHNLLVASGIDCGHGSPPDVTPVTSHEPSPRARAPTTAERFTAKFARWDAEARVEAYRSLVHSVEPKIRKDPRTFQTRMKEWRLKRMFYDSPAYQQGYRPSHTPLCYTLFGAR